MEAREHETETQRPREEDREEDAEIASSFCQVFCSDFPVPRLNLSILMALPVQGPWTRAL